MQLRELLIGLSLYKKNTSMKIYDLILLQFIAHLLSDFTFQTDEMVSDRDKKGFRSKFLHWHILIVFLFSWLFSFQWHFLLFSLIITVSHFTLDGLKRIMKEYVWGDFAFFFDQAWHIVILIGTVILYTQYFNLEPFFKLPFSTYHLILLTGFIMCTKPSNIYIAETLKLYNIKLEPENDTKFKTGRMIGITERIVALILLLYNQFAAVGFIITAKSILRYEKDATKKTEYVLIGSLLSFGIAIITFVLINELKHFLP